MECLKVCRSKRVTWDAVIGTIRAKSSGFHHLTPVIYSQLTIELLSWHGPVVFRSGPIEVVMPFHICILQQTVYRSKARKTNGPRCESAFECRQFLGRIVKATILA